MFGAGMLYGHFLWRHHGNEKDEDEEGRGQCSGSS